MKSWLSVKLGQVGASSNFVQIRSSRLYESRESSLIIIGINWYEKLTTAGAHFVRNSLSITFLAILDQYGLFFLQNGRRRPFWMSEIHFRLHFWPFQIDMQLQFFWKFLTKWLPSAILYVRNSLSIEFLAISDRYATLLFLGNFWQNGFRSHFWPFVCPKFTSDRISGHSYVRNSLSMAFLAISEPYGS